MELTSKERNLLAHILNMYVDTLIEYSEGKEPSPQVMMVVKELVVIKSVLLKMEKDDVIVLSPDS